MFLNVCSVACVLHKDEQDAHGPKRSLECQRLYMTSCQKDSYCHINMPIIEYIKNNIGQESCITNNLLIQQQSMCTSAELLYIILTILHTPPLPLWHKNSCQDHRENYNFGRPFLGHHYYILIIICLFHAPEQRRSWEEMLHF